MDKDCLITSETYTIYRPKSPAGIEVESSLLRNKFTMGFLLFWQLYQSSLSLLSFTRDFAGLDDDEINNEGKKEMPEEEEWFCPDCKNDDDIVKKGEKMKASKAKKLNLTNLRRGKVM